MSICCFSQRAKPGRYGKTSTAFRGFYKEMGKLRHGDVLKDMPGVNLERVAFLGLCYPLPSPSLSGPSGSGTRCTPFFIKKTDNFMFMTSWVCGKNICKMERVRGGWFPGEALGCGRSQKCQENPMAVANLEIQQVRSCGGECFCKGVGRGFACRGKSLW